MSLFGKLLAVANVLMAAGFLYVATLDWGKRHAWADAALQHRLAIEGLPLDDKQPDQEGSPLVKDVTDKDRQQLFAQVGQPAKTQVEELNRVKTQVQQKIDDQSVKGTKAQKLAAVLMHLAPTYEAYEKLKARAVGVPDDKDDDLQAEFDRVFTDAAADANRTPAERRQAICHVLFAMSDILRQDEGQPPPPLMGSKAYQRILAVCGLETCVAEVSAEAARLQRLTEDVRDGMALDRGVFLAADRTLLGQIEDLAEKVERQRLFLADQNNLADEQRKLVGIRKLEVDRLGKELSAAQEATQEQLKVQGRMEDELYKSQRAQRDALKKNLELERQIRTLEKGR